MPATEHQLNIGILFNFMNAAGLQDTDSYRDYYRHFGNAETLTATLFFIISFKARSFKSVRPGTALVLDPEILMCDDAD
jgi:hypothetical protein